MHINYEISEQDYAKAQGLALKKTSLFNRWVFSVIPGFGLVLLAITAVTIVGKGFSQAAPALVVALFLVSLPFLVKMNIRKLYRKSVNLHGPLSLDADQDGISFQGPTFSSRVAWSYFSRFSEDDHSFVLFQKVPIFNIIPKRGLSPEQVAELRGLLSGGVAGRS